MKKPPDIPSLSFHGDQLLAILLSPAYCQFSSDVTLFRSSVSFSVFYEILSLSFNSSLLLPSSEISSLLGALSFAHISPSHPRSGDIGLLLSPGNFSLRGGASSEARALIFVSSAAHSFRSDPFESTSYPNFTDLFRIVRISSTVLSIKCPEPNCDLGMTVGHLQRRIFLRSLLLAAVCSMSGEILPFFFSLPPSLLVWINECCICYPHLFLVHCILSIDNLMCFLKMGLYWFSVQQLKVLAHFVVVEGPNTTLQGSTKLKFMVRIVVADVHNTRFLLLRLTLQYVDVLFFVYSAMALSLPGSRKVVYNSLGWFTVRLCIFLTKATIIANCCFETPPYLKVSEVWLTPSSVAFSTNTILWIMNFKIIKGEGFSFTPLFISIHMNVSLTFTDLIIYDSQNRKRIRMSQIFWIDNFVFSRCSLNIHTNGVVVSCTVNCCIWTSLWWIRLHFSNSARSVTNLYSQDYDPNKL